jgi:glycosyltransferase involved in cell wall biosynthesis
MSRILVVTSSPPFAEGGHLVMARSLVAALSEAGHESGLMVTPQNRFGRHTSTYLSSWLADVGMTHDGRPIDQVISLRVPAYAVRHPAHVCWLNHRLREYYDLWPRFFARLSWKAQAKERVRRQLIHAVDRYLLTRHVSRVFAISGTVKARLERFGAIRSEVLYPPPPPRAYRCDSYSDFILAVSRLTPLKRLDLVIRSLAQPAAAGVRLVVAGDGEESGTLRALAAELGVSDRVQLVGPVDTAGLVDLLARCRAVCFPPYDEDYGFVTVEAFASSKAVVTCTDSGGPAELVHDGLEGFVCPPTPEAVGHALGALMGDGALAERMGAAGRQVTQGMRWEQAVRRLLLV